MGCWVAKVPPLLAERFTNEQEGELLLRADLLFTLIINIVLSDLQDAHLVTLFLQKYHQSESFLQLCSQRGGLLGRQPLHGELWRRWVAFPLEVHVLLFKVDSQKHSVPLSEVPSYHLLSIEHRHGVMERNSSSRVPSILPD